MAEIIKLNSDNSIFKILNSLKKGQIVCLPTDTIYGLSANSFNKEALIRLKKIKEREEPFILLTDSLNKIIGLINYINPVFHKLKGAGLIPGPVTLLFKARVRIEHITSDKGTIAVRIPNSEHLKTILSSVNFPIVSTSANPKGKIPAKSIMEAYNYFKEDVDLYIDNGEAENLPSTIIDISEENIQYVREGIIKFDKIKYLIDN